MRVASVVFIRFVPVELRNIPLTLLGPRSHFGDKLLIIRVFCPHMWECGSKRVIRADTGASEIQGKGEPLS